MLTKPVEKSRQEIYLRRLLSKCELRARDIATKNDWRFEKYIETASGMLLSLTNSNNSISNDDLNEYTRRIDFLRKLVELEKDTPIERVIAAQRISHTVGSTSDNNLIKEIQQKTTSKYINDVRQELFQSGKGSEVRHRKDQKTTGEDLDAQLKQHSATQEKVAEDMLLFTRTLKQQSQLAGHIIRKDIETMEQSGNQMDRNTSKLNMNADILAEYNRRAWKCWLWIILVIVIFIFISMVLFMKVMKKRVQT